MGKKFTNKLWNIARYTLLKLGSDYDWSKIPEPQNEIGQGMKKITAEITKNIEEYDFAAAANTLYHFIWHEYADKFIEETKDKTDEETKTTLAYLLITALKLLHPFMPFVTEEIYGQLPIKDKKLLLIEDWPR